MYSNYMLNNAQYGVGLDPIPFNGLQNSYGPGMLPGRMPVQVSDAGLDKIEEGKSLFGDAAKGSLIGGMLGFGSKLVNDIINFNAQYELQSRQNQWNSPQEQMQRMVAAGINPSAAAQGIAGVPNVGAAATFTPGQNSMPDLATLLGNSVNTDLNANVLKNTATNIAADTKLKESQDVGQNISNAWANKEHAAALNKMIADGDISKANAQIIGADAKYADANAYAKWMTTVQTMRKIGAEVDVLKQQLFTEMAKTYATFMAGSLSEAQIHKVFSDIGVNNATIAKLAAETSNLDADTLLKGAELKEVDARRIAQEIQNKFQNEYWNIWQNSGWDMNSNVDMNVYRMAMNGELDELERFGHGMNIYVGGLGDAKAKGKDFLVSSLNDVFRNLVIGMIGIKMPMSTAYPGTTVTTSAGQTIKNAPSTGLSGAVVR